VLNFAGNFIPEWKDAFSELPKLIRSSDWLTEYEKQMRLYNLDVKIHHHTGNCAAILVGIRKDF
ncbi:MAG: methylase, partial [Candidatus Nitrosotenuis sp.]